jgi:hypothetical protein
MPVVELAGKRVFFAEGKTLASERDATDLIALAWENKTRIVALAAPDLGDEFFRLRTRLAGEVLQKFVNYQIRVAIVGDIGQYLAASEALRAFVEESNRGDTVLFAKDTDELARRLSAKS